MRDTAGELATEVAGVETDEKSLAMEERHDLQDAAVGVEADEWDDDTGDGDAAAADCMAVGCGRVFFPLKSGLGRSSGWIGDATGSGGSGFVARYRLGFLRGIGGVRQSASVWAAIILLSTMVSHPQTRP